ncbi:MAG: hypothetical protein GY705_05575 [Bacteroidetes bacterium]|nr:hypothetical protein [Bacteroidota bacterium]
MNLIKYILPITIILGAFSCEKDKMVPIPNFIMDEMPGKFIHALAMDHEGTLWLATSEIDSSAEIPIHSSYLPSKNYLVKYQKGLFEIMDDDFRGAEKMLFDENSRLWCINSKSLFYYLGGFYADKFQLSEDDGLFEFLTIDSKNTIYTGGLKTGLVELKENGDHHIYNSDNSPLPTNSMRAIHIDAQNNIWLTLWDHGISKLDINGEWTLYNSLNSDLSDQNYWSLTSNQGNSIWAGTGWSNDNIILMRFDGEQWINVTLLEEDGTKIGGTIRQLYSGAEKIWAVTEFVKHVTFEQNYFLSYDGDQWLRKHEVPSDDGIADVVIDEQNNKVWVGMRNKGLIELDLE